MLLNLYRLKLRILLNRLKEYSYKERIITGCTVFILIIIYLGSSFLILRHYNLSESTFNLFYFWLICGLITITISRFFYNIYKEYYESGNLELLLLAPIPANSIFVYTHINITLNYAIPYIIILFPLFIVYGLLIKASLLFLGASFLAIFAFLFFISSIIQLLVISMIRIIPVSYRKEIITIITGVISFIVFLIILFYIDYIDFKVQYTNFIGETKLVLIFLKPLRWLVDVSRGFLNTNMYTGTIYLIYLVLTSLIAFNLSVVLLKKAYVSGWFSKNESRRSFIKFRFNNISLFYKLLKKLFPVEYPVIHKDFCMLFRDIKRWGVFLYPVVMLGLLVVKYYSNISTLVFCLFFYSIWMTSKLAFDVIISEGENFQLLRLGPLAAKSIIKAKFWYSVVISFLVIEISNLIVILILKMELFYFVTLFIITLIIILLTGSLATSFGYCYARFDKEKPYINYKGEIYFFVSLLAIIMLLSFIGLIIGFLLVSSKVSLILPAQILWGRYFLVGLLGIIFIRLVIYFVKLPLKALAK